MTRAVRDHAVRDTSDKELTVESHAAAGPLDPRAMFSSLGVGGFGASEGAGVVCPFCPEDDAGRGYVHGDRTPPSLQIPLHTDFLSSSIGKVSGERGGLAFWSETCPHRWMLAFGEHKGATFAEIVRLPDRQEAPPETPARGSTIAARQVEEYNIVRDARGHVGYLTRTTRGALLCTALTGYDLAPDDPVTVMVSAEDLATAYVLWPLVREAVDASLAPMYAAGASPAATVEG